MSGVTGAIANPAAVAQVVDAAAAALAVERGAVPAVISWSPRIAVDDLVQAARVHRVGHLLMDRADAIGLPRSLRTALRPVVMRQVAMDLRLAASTVRIAGILDAVGVRVLVVKGAALAMQSAGSITARASVDIDLLVRPGDLAVAHEALTAAGCAADPLPVGVRVRDWYLRMRRERTYELRAGDGPATAIDLHWRLGWHSRPIPAAGTLMGRSVPVTIADGVVETLAVPDALAAAGYHAAVDGYGRLRQLVDIARLVTLPAAAVPVDASWRLRRVLGESIALADALLGPLPDVSRFVPAGSVSASPLLDRWSRASVRPEWSVDDLSLAQVARVYARSARFAGAPAALAMALTDGLVPPERVAVGGRPDVLASAIGREVIDLVRRRVLGRPR